MKRKPLADNKSLRLMAAVALLAILGLYLLLRSPGSPPPSSTHHARAPAIGMRSFANTSNGIHIGIGLDYWVTDPRSLQGKVQYVWGSRNPRANSAHHDAYMPFELDYNLFSGNAQLGPNHNLAWWQAMHPAAVVYTCASNGTPTRTPAYYRQSAGVVDPNVPLDVNNAFVRSYQADHANELLTQGYDGIAWDDFTLTNRERRCGVYRGAPGDPWANWQPLGYPSAQNQTNAKLQADMAAWLKYVHDRIKAAHPTAAVSINSPAAFNGVASPMDLYKSRFLPEFDMDFDQSGFGGNGVTTQTIDDEWWKEEVAGIDWLNANGKAVDINAYVVRAPVGSAEQHAEADWVLANYLLVKGTHTYTYMQGYPSSKECTGRCLVDLREYGAPIGTPTSRAPSPVAGDVVYKRTYTNGEVLVNPSGTRSFAIPLGGTYKDMYGHELSSVHLGPTSGIVLLTAATSFNAVTP